MTQPTENIGNPIAPLGYVIRRGEITAYSRLTGLSRLTVRTRLLAGKLRIGPDGLIYPRPGSANAESVP